MSRHLPDCAGDDYCTGQCRYDGIAQPAILERASDISCECDWRLLHHPWTCPDSPIYRNLVAHCEFNPNWVTQLIKFWETWFCVVHGLVGDINGPIHYAVCPNVNTHYLKYMLEWPCVV